MRDRNGSRVGAVALASLILAAVVSGCTATAVHNGSGQIATPAPARAHAAIGSVGAGECVDVPANVAHLTEVHTVACSTPHDSEVFRSYSLSGVKFPGNTAIGATAARGCAGSFAQFAGIAYSRSKLLHYSWYYPTAASWSSGDRRVLCLINLTDALGRPVQATGTLRNAKE